MARKWAQGVFVPRNPEKCLNKDKIIFRSSWELKFMNKLDQNPMILQWGSEIIKIPYYNPFKKKQTLYIPDFFIKFVNAQGKLNTWLVEIKPMKEANIFKCKSLYDRASLAVNLFKWNEAFKFCSHNGIVFKILTGENLYEGL